MKNLIISLFISLAALCPAQTTPGDGHTEKPFRLTDQKVVEGQVYKLFDLNFTGKDSLMTVMPDMRLDSLITFLNSLKIANIMAVYSHFSDLGDSDKKCMKSSWNKAISIMRYLQSRGVKTNVVPKQKCYKYSFRKKMTFPKGTKNKEEFATFIIWKL